MYNNFCLFSAYFRGVSVPPATALFVGGIKSNVVILTIEVSRPMDLLVFFLSKHRDIAIREDYG